MDVLTIDHHERITTVAGKRTHFPLLLQNSVELLKITQQGKPLLLACSATGRNYNLGVLGKVTSLQFVFGFQVI